MKALLIPACLLLAAASADEHSHDHAIGDVSFETSCGSPAQAHIDRAVAWLHSFEYEEAEKAFLEAADADPDCAMSRWGIAMSNFHPLWAPPTKMELEKGQKAIAAAKAIPASERERLYIHALDQFYGSADRLDHRARSLAYLEAMARLHRSYPGDPEAGVFYALALIAAGTMDSDATFAREKEAAAILDAVLARQPKHPGVAHYLIHGYDYPPLASFALPAARSYAAIAPSSAHAQHMPSHIFTRLGLWEEAIASNLGAEAAARAYAAKQKMAGSWDERLHAMDYLVYGYLQLGRDEKARAILAELQAIERVDPPNFKVAYAMSAIPARYVLERGKWDEAAALALPERSQAVVDWKLFSWGDANIVFARAVGAARSGRIEQSRSEIARLTAIADALPTRQGEYDWGKQVEIQRLIAAAWLAAAENKKDEALRLMRAAADLDDATEKHPVTPGSILPGREQLAELLVEFGRPSEALVEYDASLARAPGRLASLYGATRAARLAGDETRARSLIALLPACDADCTRAELKNVSASLASVTR
jgi:hypothetical protein